MTKKGKETILYRFNGTDGFYPVDNLFRDAAGNIYGTTEYGGDLTCGVYGCGTAFKLGANGAETVLHIFEWPTDGAYPLAGLVRDKAGNLYGTTSNNGPSKCNQYGCGTVFKLTP